MPSRRAIEAGGDKGNRPTQSKCGSGVEKRIAICLNPKGDAGMPNLKCKRNVLSARRRETNTRTEDTTHAAKA